MTTHSQGGTRRLRATIIGLGLDGQDQGPHRIINGEDCLTVGGSDQTHADMLETMLMLEGELERIGRTLGEVEPAELADIAWRIDSPELHEIAMRIDAGLKASGRTFGETSAEELTDLAAGLSA